MLSDKSDLVFYLFFLCLISDYLDGLFARRLNVVSDYGKQLDSLADLISFELYHLLLFIYGLISLLSIIFISIHRY